MKVLYKTKASASGGRNGHVQTEDGMISLDLAMPKELGGPGGAKTNPEQLFAAGYAACFDNALLHAAAKQKIRLTGTRVDAAVSIGPKEDGSFGLAVSLGVSIPDVPREQAQALTDEAHRICPYSNATRDNIPVTVFNLGTCQRL